MERVMTSWLGQGTVLLAGDGGFNPIQTGPWELYFWTVLVFEAQFRACSEYSFGSTRKLLAHHQR